MRKLLVTCLAVAVLCMSSPSFADDLFFYEPFDYTAGIALDGQGDWAAGTPVTVASAGLSYPGITSSGNAVTMSTSQDGSAVNLQAGFDPLFNTDGSFYITFLHQGTWPDGGSVGFWPYNNPGNGALNIGAVSTAGGSYNYFVLDNSGNEHTASPGLLTTGTDLVAMKITINTAAGQNDTCQTAINPNLSLGEPTWGAADITADFSGNKGYYMRVASSTASPILDEVRVASSWSQAISGTSVTPLPPPKLRPRPEIEKRTTILASSGRAQMTMARHPDGSIYLNLNNPYDPLLKSSDEGENWTQVAVNLPGVPANQVRHGLGVSSTGRIFVVHQDSGLVAGLYGQSLYVSYSDDGGKTWKKSPTDFGRISPGLPNMHFHEDGVRTFIEQPDGTLMFTTTITAAPDYRKKYPPKSPLGPPNYYYGGKPTDFFSDIVLRSYDGGVTWGDPSRVYPKLSPHESALALDPYDPRHILIMTRIQSAPSWHTEKEAQKLMQETGNPQPNYKNGALFESTDGGRTFSKPEGGVTEWYNHRGSIFWADNDVVIVTHSDQTGRLLARISYNGGETWVADELFQTETPFMNQSEKFELASTHSFASPTLALGDYEFLTAYYDGTDVRGVFWSIPVPEPPH